SAYIYKWDAAASDWLLNQVQVYSYADGLLSTVLTRDHMTGDELARTDYSYNGNGRPVIAVNYIFRSSWVFSTRALTEYDIYDRVSAVRVQKWVGEKWVEDRLQEGYEYDPDGKLTGYRSIFWRNNAWTMPTTNELFYNDSGNLESHLATRPDGNIDFRIIYEYNEMGLQTQLYTQYPVEGGWSNWNLRTYGYDGCGRKSIQVQYSGKGPDWVPSTKTVFFTSFRSDRYTGRKVPVCHKSHTIWVSIHAVDAHLRHGDCIGECISERAQNPATRQCAPFTVYPNPARDRVTLRFASDCECQMKKVELTDFSGRVLKAYTIGDNSDLIVDRGNLRPGHYFIRVTGNEVWSLPVIFE
ncbi:MAG: T9SS type A sorting domain-containing protein, partial [Actinomycetota bacterium]